MESYYLELRIVHIAAVIASGSLFLVRALALNLGRATWPLARSVRSLAYAIDTLLLAAAIALAAVIGQYPFVEGWLTAKVLLLILYILLGYRALRGATLARRLVCLAGAAATFAAIVGVARAHHPLGFLAG